MTFLTADFLQITMPQALYNTKSGHTNQITPCPHHQKNYHQRIRCRHRRHQVHLQVTKNKTSNVTQVFN
jgi:hypothetical protein